MNLCTFLLLSVLFSGVELLDDQEKLSREKIATALAQIDPGMDARQVQEILGRPDEVVDVEDEERQSESVRYSGATMVWCYGTETGNSFPTLGQVHLNSQSKVIVVYGRNGNPADLSRIGESDIRKHLRLIASMSVADGGRWDPLNVVKVANGIQDLGKTDGLAVIQEFLRVSPPSFAAHEKVCLLLRILHEIPEQSGHFPKLKLGLAVHGEPKDPNLLPRFPVYLINDVPLLLVNGYDYSGDVPTNTVEIVEWYRRHGNWRENQLDPPKLSEEKVTELLEKTSNVLRSYLASSEATLAAKTIRKQLLWTRKSTVIVKFAK